MECSYMIVAFLEEQPVGKVLGPPKHPHITIKKKFKLINIDEKQLIKLLADDKSIRGIKKLILGEVKDYDSDANKFIEVLNPEVWVKLHHAIIKLLGSHIESRDPHFEGVNYIPHVTWKLKGEVTLDPTSLKNTIYQIKKLYLIQRVDPVVSRARIVATINL